MDRLARRVVRTDAEGRFTVPRDLPPGAFRLAVRADGFLAEPTLLRCRRNRPSPSALHLAPVSDAVVVSAALVPRPLSESPAAATVIAREDVERRQLENVADAIRTLPGFTVGRNGGRGALTSVFPAAANPTIRWCSWTACASTHSAAASISRSCHSATSSR